MAVLGVFPCFGPLLVLSEVWEGEVLFPSVFSLEAGSCCGLCPSGHVWFFSGVIPHATWRCHLGEALCSNPKDSQWGVPGGQREMGIKSQLGNLWLASFRKAAEPVACLHRGFTKCLSSGFTHPLAYTWVPALLGSVQQGRAGDTGALPATAPGLSGGVGASRC